MQVNISPTDLKSQLDILRQRGAAASHPEEYQALLKEARVLLKATFQTPLEDDARKLFRELRQRSDTASVSPQAQVSQRIQHERIRLKSGVLGDMELAIGALYNLLRDLGNSDDNGALRAEIVETIQSAVIGNEALKRKLKELLESPTTPLLRATQAQLASLTGQPINTQSQASVTERLKNARRLFYAGDYYEAVDVLTDILHIDPDNQEARERITQIEDNIRRGVIPDSRVPFDARAAFGRAQSLERAGRFEEARQGYSVALAEARKGGALLHHWQPAVEALLRVDNSIIARTIRDEADVCLKSDQWLEATEKYTAVLKLLPDDDHARERLHQVRVLLEQSEVVRTRYSVSAVNLLETSQKFIELRQTISRLRPQMPESQRLNELESSLNATVSTLKDRLVERSEQLTTQARYLPSASGSRRLIAEAARHLDQARALAPSDGDIFERSEGLKSDLARLEQVEQELAEIRRLLNLNTSAGRIQARDLLRRLQDFNQETVYLQLLSALQAQYLEATQSAMRRKQYALAGERLADAMDDVFGILGISDESLRLQQELDIARRGPWLRRLALTLGIIGIISIIALAGFGRVMSVYGVDWLFTPTPSPQPSPTMTLTATASPTETPPPTRTLRPTFTTVPTLAALLPGTPAPTLRTGAINKDAAARQEPSNNSSFVFSLRIADPVQVLEEATDAGGVLWYKILYVRDGSILVGWTLATNVNVMTVSTPN